MNSDIRRVLDNLLDNMEVLYCGKVLMNESGSLYIPLNKDITDYMNNGSHAVMMAADCRSYSLPLSVITDWTENTDYYSFDVYMNTSSGLDNIIFKYFPSDMIMRVYDNSGLVRGLMSLVIAIPITT